VKKVIKRRMIMKTKLMTIYIVLMMWSFQGCSYLGKVKAKQGILSLLLNLLVLFGVIAGFVYMWWKKKQ
jgi:hypothetical protein